MANNNSGDFKAIIAIFVGVIIAIVLLSSISDSIFQQTNTITVTNETVVVAAINTSVATTGRDLVGIATVSNSSASGALDNFTGLNVVDTILISGGKTISITANDTATGFVGQSVNVSYTANPDGYLSESGTRSIALLIIIFGAIAAFMFIIIVLVQGGSFRELMRKGRSR